MVLSLQDLESFHHPSSVIQTKSVGEGESVVEDNVDCQVGPDKFINAASPYEQQFPEHSQS